MIRLGKVIINRVTEYDSELAIAGPFAYNRILLRNYTSFFHPLHLFSTSSTNLSFLPLLQIMLVFVMSILICIFEQFISIFPMLFTVVVVVSFFFPVLLDFWMISFNFSWLLLLVFHLYWFQTLGF